MKKPNDQSQELTNLCFNILYLRYKFGILQYEMAKILCVPLRTIKFMENKLIVPESVDVESLFKMHEYFGYDLSKFFLFCCGDFKHSEK